MKVIILCIFSIISVSGFSQELINGHYDFQLENMKAYTLYIPSSYESGSAIDMMVGLHPWNTSRWNANSWCDTLKTFAEANNLLLVCPDGGTDGQIDDPIDTAFTTFLIDQVRDQYTVNDSQIYLMGFSWGGKTVYTYGLQHAARFAGYLVVGAAANESEVAPHKDAAQNQNFYVIHGSQDSPNVRFTPIVDLLSTTHCVESKLLPGVGHTIDFDNRNAILTEAFQYLKTNNCGTTSTTEVLGREKLLKKTVFTPNERLDILDHSSHTELAIYNSSGVLVSVGETLLAPARLGMYYLVSSIGNTEKFVVN